MRDLPENLVCPRCDEELVIQSGPIVCPRCGLEVELHTQPADAEVELERPVQGAAQPHDG